MRRSRLILVAASLLALVVAAAALRQGGQFLVVDNRQKSDAILITQGDELDRAYWTGLQLLMQGYGRELLIDARTNRIFFGRSQADMADEFVRKTAGGLSGRVKVCPLTADTTAEEVYEARKCLDQNGARSVLLLSDDYHTRRSLLISSRLLPGYHWSVERVRAPKDFGEQWWRRREWIRTTAVQWQHLIWWEMIDRWHFTPVPAPVDVSAPPK